eukprot:2754919-Alexandrium_andersonii.AAC.1
MKRAPSRTPPRFCGRPGPGLAHRHSGARVLPAVSRSVPQGLATRRGRHGAHRRGTASHHFPRVG